MENYIHASLIFLIRLMRPLKKKVKNAIRNVSIIVEMNVRQHPDAQGMKK